MAFMFETADVIRPTELAPPHERAAGGLRRMLAGTREALRSVEALRSLVLARSSVPETARGDSTGNDKPRDAGLVRVVPGRRLPATRARPSPDKADAKEREHAGFRHGRDGAEQAIDLVVDPGREIQLGRVASVAAIPERQSPQPGIRDRCAVVVLELAGESARLEVECADAAIFFVAHQQRPAELAEGRRRERHAPRRVERPAVGVRRDTPQKIPVEVERVTTPPPEVSFS